MKSQSIRGMNDILPEVSATWRRVETIVGDVIESYGYRQIRLPILEYTEVFARAIGDATDIVEKEMYTFSDRNDESLTMRPEATAGMVRAGITNGLFHNQQPAAETVDPGSNFPI
jgi:histidyl-tRNA synthetase